MAGFAAPMRGSFQSGVNSYALRTSIEGDQK